VEVRRPALYVGQRYDDVATKLVLDAYTTVDLYAELPGLEELVGAGRIVNVGDTTYETAYGYNQPAEVYLTVVANRSDTAAAN